MDFLDRDLDDAELWAVIDSAAASSRSRKPLLALKNHSDSHVAGLSPIPSKPFRNPRPIHGATPPSPQVFEVEEVSAPADGEVVQGEHYWATLRPHKMARIGTGTADERRMVVVRNPTPRVPEMSVASPSYGSPEPGRMKVKEVRPMMIESPPPEGWQSAEKENSTRHNIFGHFPSVSSFKEYQNAAISILDKTDYTMISGNPYIKKTGWRKISFFFNISYEIKDRSIEFDEKRDVQRAEFVVRAYMQGGRFSDGWGSCERREKRFLKANHDIPSTAETRAKNKACQDLLGIGAPTRIR